MSGNPRDREVSPDGSKNSLNVQSSSEDQKPTSFASVSNYGATETGHAKLNSSEGGQSMSTQSNETDKLIERSERSREGLNHIYTVLNPADTCKREEHATSAFETLVHLVKASVGTGLLALPLAVKNAGLAVGGVSLILLGIIATHCMLMLVDVARTLTKRYPMYQTLNYSQVSEIAISEYTRKIPVIKLTGVFVNIFLIITQFGFCCVYFVFIAVNLNQVFCSVFGANLAINKFDAIHIWIGIIILPLVVFCWIRNFDSLSSFSTVANVCIFFCLAVIFYEAIDLFSSNDPEHQAAALHGGIKYFPASVTSAALFFGNAIYSFEGIGMVLPLENKIAKPGQFKGVLWLGMGIVIFLYISVGVLGYAVYGESIQASITLNLEISYDRVAESIVFLIVRLFYTYVIFASFMLQFYVPMDFLEPPLLRALNWKKHFPEHKDKLTTVSRVVFRTVIVLVIAAFALALPDLGDLIALVGAVASSALALIFPPLLHLLVCSRPVSPISSRVPMEHSQRNFKDTSVQHSSDVHHKQSSLSKLYRVAWIVKDVLIMALGIVGFVLGTYAAINGLVGYFEKERTTNNTCVNFFPS